MTFSRVHRNPRLEKWKHSLRSAGSTSLSLLGLRVREVKWFAQGHRGGSLDLELLSCCHTRKTVTRIHGFKTAQSRGRKVQLSAKDLTFLRTFNLFPCSPEIAGEVCESL